MKKCPFCAEEIQDEAIKCRYCGSFLSTAPKDGGSPTQAPAQDASAPATPARATGGAAALSPATTAGGTQSERKVLYSGVPSWRAYLQPYFYTVIGALVVPFAALWVAGMFEASALSKAMAVAIPIAICVIAFAAITLWRRSKVFRITTSNIETEYGLLSKKIDVLELWRCRDVRYRQSLMDRILRIAHIDIYTADVTTPNLCIVGLPASRQLFEQIRDSIEIQRQSRNVVGFVQ